jgi:hypothetical protein
MNPSKRRSPGGKSQDFAALVPLTLRAGSNFAARRALNLATG